MELCETCKKEKCNKSLIIIEEGNLKTIKCVEYEKDISKIRGYEKLIKRSAKPKPVIMKGLLRP